MTEAEEARVIRSHVGLKMWPDGKTLFSTARLKTITRIALFIFGLGARKILEITLYLEVHKTNPLFAHP